jgi:hypothetical protein
MSDPFGSHAVLSYAIEDLTGVFSIENSFLALFQHNSWLRLSGLVTMQLVD